MDPDIQKAVDTGKVGPESATALEKLKPGAFCSHKSWGFGRITEWNVLINQITIDFHSKKGHSMQFSYAVESLDPIPDNHILAMVASDPAGVKALSVSDPVGLVRTLLTSFEGKASQDRIQSALVPSAMAESEFKKWWTVTKRKLGKDGHFNVPDKRTAPLELRDEAVSPAAELLQAFDSSNQLKTRITALNQILKNLPAFSGGEASLAGLVAKLDELVSQNRRLHKAEAVELALGAAEIRNLVKAVPRLPDPSLSVESLVAEMTADLGVLLEAVPAAKQKHVIVAIENAFGDLWVDRALDLMRGGSARINAEVSRVLLERGHGGTLESALDRWIRERSIRSETLFWLCKERKKNFLSLVGPRLLAAILSSLERDQFDEKRSNKLQDLLHDDKDLIPDMVSGADRDTAREMMRHMMLSPVFEELTKRSLLARIIKLHPGVEDLLEDTHSDQQQGFIVSWSSLRTKQAELEDIVTKQIPANIKEIQIAREYGDLRENFEFKAAKEMQRVLGRRRLELEQDITKARGTTFRNPDTNQVSIGTVVTLGLPDSSQVQYTLLGAWDSNPEKSILSYLTVIGQALLGKKPGDAVQLPGGDEPMVGTILSIGPCDPDPEPVDTDD